ncbi:hypothetical protein NITLEN_30415 [Nitrospira lenta]|uniref:Uncharacterized protein n=1 Tax=Nitrospira lenta TaxID=1436998 RepID=A0A330L8C6_9BACT|nr:hypothetical protein NITLEN_30415 [Nitrospira lenta]
MRENSLKYHVSHCKLPPQLGQSGVHVLQCFPIQQVARRGARVAEWTRLESGRPRKGTVGSNPTLSAKQHSLDPESFLWYVAMR